MADGQHMRYTSVLPSLGPNESRAFVHYRAGTREPAVANSDSVAGWCLADGGSIPPRLERPDEFEIVLAEVQCASHTNFLPEGHAFVHLHADAGEPAVAATGKDCADNVDGLASALGHTNSSLLDWLQDMLGQQSGQLQDMLEQQAGQNCERQEPQRAGEAARRGSCAEQQGHLQRISPLADPSLEIPPPQEHQELSPRPPFLPTTDFQDDDLIKARRYFLRLRHGDDGAEDDDKKDAEESEWLARETQQDSEDNEDPRTWTRGMITGNIVVRDEVSGKSFIVPYDLAKLRDRFRSSDYKDDRAHKERQQRPALEGLEEHGPDLSQSMNSRTNTSWKDDKARAVREDILRGELRAIALDRLPDSWEKAGASWSHGTFMTPPQDSVSVERSSEEEDSCRGSEMLADQSKLPEGGRQHMLERKLANLKSDLQASCHLQLQPTTA